MNTFWERQKKKAQGQTKTKHTNKKTKKEFNSKKEKLIHEQKPPRIIWYTNLFCPSSLSLSAFSNSACVFQRSRAIRWQLEFQILKLAQPRLISNWTRPRGEAEYYKVMKDSLMPLLQSTFNWVLQGSILGGGSQLTNSERRKGQTGVWQFNTSKCMMKLLLAYFVPLDLPDKLY